MVVTTDKLLVLFLGTSANVSFRVDPGLKHEWRRRLEHRQKDKNIELVVFLLLHNRKKYERQTLKIVMHIVRCQT